ncbi:MAG: FlgD immunoglobulin-like domain containing protein [Candidatus Latescibacterota bacterium]
MLRTIPLIWLSILQFALLVKSVEAVDSLGVGFRGSIARWNQGVAEARFVAIRADSIWTWNVQPNSNLAPGTVERDGYVLMPGADEGVATFIEGAEVMFDGADSTAFNPDDFADRFGVERTSPLYIDLGATFRVDRIRLYPRQDADHKTLFPRSFSLSTNGGIDQEREIEEGNLLERRFESVFNYYTSNPNREPVLERRFESRYVRFIRIQVRDNQPWEIAELQVFSDGTGITGEYTSIPILAARGPRPLWGRVRYEGGDMADLPVTVQTRTGPDASPQLYYRYTGVGGDREQVSAAEYTRLDSIEQGPILRNPDWSSWETVTDGRVRSPSNNPFIQFRLQISGPGTVIRRLAIEYLNPPIADGLDAEIAPVVVEAGQQTDFVVSLQTHMRVWRTDGSLLPNADTGFQSLRIQTTARIDAIDRVLVDDREVEFTATYDPVEGTGIRLRRTILQDGTFIQIFLRGAVFRDATRFDVQASDRRLVEGELLTVHQSAREEDVDPLSLGGSLVVRIASEEGRLPLLQSVSPSSPIISPNGDGINDRFELRYALLKLTDAAPSYLNIYALDGRLVRQIEGGLQLNGDQIYRWDGFDAQGDRLTPGLYIYRLSIHTDEGVVQENGVIGVAY